MIVNKRYNNRSWLYDQYWTKKKTLKQVGEMCGVTELTILRWMKKIGIARRKSGFLVGKKFISEHRERISIANSGKNHYEWKGGKGNYYRKQARKIWKEYWQENIPKGYYIHHVDGNVANNDICNLALLTPKHHSRVHNLCYSCRASLEKQCN